MKALTLHRPWPELILRHGKNIENRVWAPPENMLGKVIAIHAGSEISDVGLAALLSSSRTDKTLVPSYMDEKELLAGPCGIVGLARIAGWFETFVAAAANKEDMRLVEAARHSPWFHGPFGWVLVDVRPLLRPIPCRGMQRLWEVPWQLQQEIGSQFAERAGL